MTNSKSTKDSEEDYYIHLNSQSPGTFHISQQVRWCCSDVMDKINQEGGADWMLKRSKNMSLNQTPVC